MAKQRFSLSMEKGKLLIVTLAEIDSFMLVNEFSENVKKQIRAIRKKVSRANIILFFLNYNNRQYILDSFLPIYNRQEDYDHDPVVSIERVLHLTPLKRSKPIEFLGKDEIEAIARYIFYNAHWAKEYGFGLQEDNMPIAQIDITPYADKPISQGVIDFFMGQLEACKIKASKQPEFEPRLHDMVKMIEGMRRERDAATGFRSLQIAAHDYALKLPDMIKGDFDAKCFDLFFALISDFFNNVYKSMGDAFSLTIGPVAEGSAVLLVDLVPDKTLPEDKVSHWKKVKEHLNQTVEALPILTRQGDPQKRVNTFCKEAKLEPEQAHEILKTARKLFPPSSHKEKTIEICSRSEDKPLARFDYEGRDYFNAAKKNLSDSLKPVEDAVVSGFLGIIIGWDDEKLRFVIETDEGRRLTIRCDKEKTEEVRKRFKQNVKLERVKDGRGWYLLDWK
jgi:hypothetical protein